MELLRLQTEHLKTCAELYYQVFTHEPFCFDWLNLNQVMRYFGDMIATPGFTGFVYFFDGQLAGACLGQIDDYFQMCVYRIHEFVIAPDVQGQGVGTAFLLDIEERLKLMGVASVSLFTQKQMRAFTFYQRNGYFVNDETSHLVKVLGS